MYKNDAMEIFIGGDTVFDGSYSNIDHQFVIDWANRTREYRNDPGRVPVSGFSSAVKLTPTGYQVETRVAATELGRTSLTAGTKLGFSIANDESNGTDQAAWMVWFHPNLGACGNCCNSPCSTRYFGGLALQP